MSNRICSPFKNVLTFSSPFLKSAVTFHKSSLVLIRKSFLINPCLFQWTFQYSLQYFPVVSLYSQFDLSPASVFEQKLSQRNAEEQSHQLSQLENVNKWLLLNFVPTIEFTSSQFPAYEKPEFFYFLEHLTREFLVNSLLIYNQFTERKYAYHGSLMAIDHFDYGNLTLFRMWLLMDAP